MTQEQLKKIISNELLIKEFIECWNRYQRLRRNKMMYDVFTPTLVKWWHKIKGEKPYLELNYEPKL